MKRLLLLSLSCLLGLMEAKKPIIAVVGATGLQGRGVVDAIVNDPDKSFSCRALTRNPDSAKGKELAKLGCEVVAANSDDKDSMLKAFKGVYGAFLLTNFWEHFDVEREITQAMNMADAAKAAGVEHVIWSTLESALDTAPKGHFPPVHGKWVLPHFDSKAEADKYMKRIHLPTTYLFTSWYMENLHLFDTLNKLSNGKISLTVPLGQELLPVVSVRDIGLAAFHIFKNKDKYLNKDVKIAGDKLRAADLVAKVSKATGYDIVYTEVSHDALFNMGFPGAKEFANMYAFKRDFPEIFTDARIQLNTHPKMLNLDEYLTDPKEVGFIKDRLAQIMKGKKDEL